MSSSLLTLTEFSMFGIGGETNICKLVCYKLVNLKRGELT